MALPCRQLPLSEIRIFPLSISTEVLRYGAAGLLNLVARCSQDNASPRVHKMSTRTCGTRHGFVARIVEARGVFMDYGLYRAARSRTFK